MRTVQQLMDMSGRTVLITGATGNLGQHMVETIAELNGNLILVDRPDSNYSILLEKLKIYKCNIECIECDLESDNHRTEMVHKINNLNLPVNVLINNAAFGGTTDLQGWVAPLEGQTIKTWRRAMEVNLTAAFDLSKSLLPKLKKNRNGSIINISSIYGSSSPVHSMYEGKWVTLQLILCQKVC